MRTLAQKNDGYFDRLVRIAQYLVPDVLAIDALTNRSGGGIQFHHVAHVLLRCFLNHADVAAPMICPCWV